LDPDVGLNRPEFGLSRAASENSEFLGLGGSSTTTAAALAAAAANGFVLAAALTKGLSAGATATFFGSGFTSFFSSTTGAVLVISAAFLANGFPFCSSFFSSVPEMGAASLKVPFSGSPVFLLSLLAL